MEHNIQPKGIQKAIPDLIQDFNDLVGSNEKKSAQSLEKDLPESIEEIKKQMKIAADALEFEKAAQLRDKLKKLEQLAVQEL